MHIDEEYIKISDDYHLQMDRLLADYQLHSITSDKAMELIYLENKNFKEKVRQFYEKYK